MLFLGVPLLLVGLLLLVYMTRKGPHPETWKMSEKWTHPPILWAATDEDVGGAHGGHGGHVAVKGSEFTVGGGASGTW